MIEKHNHEALIFYNEENTLDREILFAAKDHFRNVREVEVNTYMPTGTRMIEIALLLDIQVGNLVNEDSPLFSQFADLVKSTDERGIIQLLQHNPKLFKTPIVIVKNRGIIIRSMSDMMEFVDRKLESV